MKVYKFGGASVNSVERIQNLASILIKEQGSGEQLVIIISAMGKTTNGLEKVAAAFYEGKKEEALQLFTIIKQQHLNTSKYLLVTHFNECLSYLTDFFTEVEWLLHDKPVREFDYYYDQIVCIGELLSTCIVSHYLSEKGILNHWLDVRDLLRTDNNFREGNIDWAYTSQKIRSAIHDPSGMYITQGFIGATEDNESTTLGREGSDYTAAVFANILQATSVTIWKDVIGIMNADPKQFPEASLLSELSYTEVIEMAFYGAQVIHPKTIKPLQNKQIPLFVKCFTDPELPGTLIHQHSSKQLPPVLVIKNNQVMMHLTSLDFSFVGESLMKRLYTLFATNKIKPNLIQTGAINVQICLDEHSEKIDHIAAAASNWFDVQIEKQLHLITIRHYTPEILDKLIAGKKQVFLQQTKNTFQMVYTD